MKIAKTKTIKCGHSGCDKSDANATMFTVGKGHFCAAHFTGERAATKPKESTK